MSILYSFLYSWWGVLFIYGVGPVLFVIAWRSYTVQRRQSATDRPAQITLYLLSSSLILWVVFLIFPAVGIPPIGRPGSYSSWVHVMLTTNLLICGAAVIAGVASRQFLRVILPVVAIAVALHWVRVTIP